MDYLAADGLVDQRHEIGLKHQAKLHAGFLAELVKNPALEKA